MVTPFTAASAEGYRLTRDRYAVEYQLHIKKVLGFKHWYKRRRKPKRVRKENFCGWEDLT